MFVSRLHVLLALALATAAGVSAQNISIPPCVVTCGANALNGSGCTSLTDIKCLCASTTFQSVSKACIDSTCSSSDQAAASQIKKQECGSQSNTTNTTNPTNPTNGTNNTSSSPSSSPASTSKSSNALAPIEQLPFVTVFIAIAGVALGGAFVL